MRRKRAVALAVSKAKQSDIFHSHGAVVMKNGKVLSSGKNRYSNHVVQSHHAETVALAGCKKHSLRGATLIVVRVMPRGDKCGLSMPCELCQRCIESARIRTVFYSTSDE